MKLRIRHFTMLLPFIAILLSGCSGRGQDIPKEHADPNNQAEFGPVPANYRKPVEQFPFAEPSFERLIEQFKADVAANKGDPEMLKRKKQVVENPDLLWKSNFEVPPKFFRYYKVPPIPKSDGYTEFGEPVHITKDQEEKIDVLKKSSLAYSDQEIDKINYHRKKAAIYYEGVDILRAAQRLSFMSDGPNPQRVVALVYAERAMRENPSSVVAARTWVNCHLSKDRIYAYKQLLSKFPNDAFSHQRIARLYYNDDYYEEALHHIRKASQLDSRIAKTNPLLVKCYYAVGEWEKAVATYQSMDYVYAEGVGHEFRFFPNKLDVAKDHIHRERYGFSFLEQVESIRRGEYDR